MNRADAATPVELVRNGGFETGHPPVPWTQDRSRGRTLVATDGPDGGPAAGKYSIRLGGSNNESDRIAQEFLIPPGVAAVDLTFRYRIRHNGNGSADGDRLRVAVADVENGTERVVLDLTGADDTTGEWRVAGPVSLLPEAGRYVALSFTGTTDRDKPTTFSLDEVRAVAIPSGRASEIKLSFVNPRLGCRDILPPRDVTASGLLPIDVVAGEDGGIAALFLELDGRRIAREHQARLHFDLDTTTLSPGPHVLEAQAITTDGRLRVCRIDITPLDILRNGNFEEALDLDNWVYSTNAAGRQPLAGGPDPLPADGNLMAALGGVSRVTEKLTQSLHFPADLAAATLSYHVRIATTRNQAGVDLLRVKLRHVPLVGTPTETILATYANPTSSETGWTLEGIAIPPDTITSLAGKDVQLVFEAVNGGGMGTSTASTFFVDAVALMAQSNLLVTLNAPQVELTFNPVGPALCPSESGGPVTFTATATTLAGEPADSLRVYMDGLDLANVIAECNSCSALGPIDLVLPASDCHKFMARAAHREIAATTPVQHLFFDSTVQPTAEDCGRGPTPPTPLLTEFPAPGEVVSGIRLLTAVSPPASCLDHLEIWISPLDAASTEPTRMILRGQETIVSAGWLSAGVTNGTYAIWPRAYSATGRFADGPAASISIDNPVCWHSQRCEASLLPDYATKCQQGSTGDCLRSALCSATFAFRAVSAQDDWAASAGANLGSGMFAMETMEINGGSSIFNSYPAVALALAALEIEDRLVHEGDPRDLDTVTPPSPASGFGAAAAWTRVARILARSADAYPFSDSVSAQRSEGCGDDTEVGDTCAEERAGQATAIRLMEELFPSASGVECRGEAFRLLSRSVLSSADESVDCGSGRLVLFGDRVLRACPSTPHLRLFNHGEENPSYAAAVISQLAATDGISRLFGGRSLPEEPTASNALNLTRWMASKASSPYQYRANACLRLERTPGTCVRPRSDETEERPGVWVPQHDCDGWPYDVTCPVGCFEYDVLDGGSLFVDCADTCQTSSGVPRQPCWNPIFNFARSLFETAGQAIPLNLLNFDAEPGRLLRDYNDETDLFYYEIASRLPDRRVASGRLFAPKCIDLEPPAIAGRRIDNSTIEVAWSAPLAPVETEVYARSSASPLSECPISESSCDWRLLAAIDWSDHPAVRDCTASDCVNLAYVAVQKLRDGCRSLPSNEVHFVATSPCGVGSPAPCPPATP